MSSGAHVTKPWFVNQIRDTLRALGLPQNDYAVHSFRIGAATTAAFAGIADSSIHIRPDNVLGFSSQLGDTRLKINSNSQNTHLAVFY